MTNAPFLRNLNNKYNRNDNVRFEQNEVKPRKYSIY